MYHYNVDINNGKADECALDRIYGTRPFQRGIGRESFIVLSVPASSPDEIEHGLIEHLSYRKKLEADGHLFAAGPLADEAGEVWSMEGLIILGAQSLDHAHRLGIC